MKNPFLLLVLAIGGWALLSKATGEPAAKPEYVDEAPLPEGWPTPGPYDEAVEKQLPAYRAAFTPPRLLKSEFMTLFGHIKKHDIPMTAPVEMGMKVEGKSMDRGTMAFLYQNQQVGKAGKDGEEVEVRDVPAAKVLTYAWQGPDSGPNLLKARTALEAKLQEKGIENPTYRLLGYNGPRTPRAKSTWELQVLLPPVEKKGE
ncbi:MAG: heme-binding protein [Verrucomicrobiales bacterium]